MSCHVLLWALMRWALLVYISCSTTSCMTLYFNMMGDSESVNLIQLEIIANFRFAHSNYSCTYYTTLLFKKDLIAKFSNELKSASCHTFGRPQWNMVKIGFAALCCMTLGREIHSSKWNKMRKWNIKISLWLVIPYVELLMRLHHFHSVDFIFTAHTLHTLCVSPTSLNILFRRFTVT